jgi:fermentation-respiration switch protein FrsA (DUF1100 family)
MFPNNSNLAWGRFLAATGLLALTLTLLPARAAHAQACAQTVIVQSGETLSIIAGRTLGNQLAYPQIVAATNAQAATDATFTAIANPNVVPVGAKLCIPGSAASLPAAPAIPTAPAAPAATAVPAAAAVPAVRAAPAASAGGPVAATANTNAPDVEIPVEPETLTIAYLRQQEYPGSEIVVEQTLAPGSNYSRHIVSYESEGLNIDAYMTVPNGTPPATGWPVVVFNHGYIPPEVYRPTERYIAYQDAFARNGYIVLRPDYRGHASSEGEATGAYGSPGYTIDVLNAVASIKQYPAADPNRIGMWGHSLGGFISLRAMLVDPDIKAGVIWAGVVGSYEDMLNNWRRRRNSIPSTIPQRARRWRQQLQEQMGTPAENPAYWRSISANSFLEDLSGPVQFHHGDADGDVPVEFSRTAAQQVLDAGGVSEYYEYPGDDHNLSGYFNTAMERSVAFMDQHVKNAGQ